MKHDNGLPAYLAERTADEQQLFLELAELVAAVPVPQSISALVFHPNQADHPHWEDAASVFWQGVTGLYLSQPLSAGELPLVYWGFHSYNLLARRSANGVLLTDRGVYVVDAGRDSWALPIGAVAASGFLGSTDSLVIGSAAIDLRVAKRLFEPGDAHLSADYLSTVLEVVQQRLGVEPQVAAVRTPQELIAVSSFSADFQVPSRAGDAKKLAKLVAKWELPAGEPMLCALSSSTFAGVYGLAITGAAIYSRDLMEPLDRTPRGDVGAIVWVEVPPGFRVREGHVIPTHPSITESNREEFTALLAALVSA